MPAPCPECSRINCRSSARAASRFVPRAGFPPAGHQRKPATGELGGGLAGRMSHEQFELVQREVHFAQLVRQDRGQFFADFNVVGILLELRDAPLRQRVRVGFIVSCRVTGTVIFKVFGQGRQRERFDALPLLPLRLGGGELSGAESRHVRQMRVRQAADDFVERPARRHGIAVELQMPVRQQIQGDGDMRRRGLRFVANFKNRPLGLRQVVELSWRKSRQHDPAVEVSFAFLEFADDDLLGFAVNLPNFIFGDGARKPAATARA